MNKYYIRFINNGKPVCGCIKCAVDADTAMLDAEFALICKYPNVNYTSVTAELLEAHV